MSASPPVIHGIVLAAGRSRRMGAPKPLLRAGGRTFLRRAVDALRDGGCAGIVAVVPDDDAIRAEAESAGARIVVNRLPASEQADSLRLGLDALPAGADAAVVLPVDHPLVATPTVKALIDAFASRAPRPAIALPARDGIAGHPVLIARAVFDDVRPDRLPEGLRSVLAAHEAETVLVPVDDEGIAIDLDTPADLRRHFGDG